jgi:hypothetical protein
LFGVCVPAAAQQPSIVGTWEWTRKNNNCSEHYVFRDDGTMSVKSGDAQTEGKYLMAWAAEPTGRYKLSLTTIEDSGGPGCADTVADRQSRQGVVYVLFGGSRETMIVCNSPEGADCIGPLKKAAR